MALYGLRQLDHRNAYASNGSYKPYLINNLSYLHDSSFVPVYKGCGTTDMGQHFTSEYPPYVGWVTRDATTMDASAGVRLCLDTPPMTSGANRTLFDARYKQWYPDYTHLPGQIQYYMRPEMTRPFAPPLWSADTTALAGIRIDSMDNVHYDFYRANGQNGCPAQPERCGECFIRELRDVQDHREDILASHTARLNRNKYEPIWFNWTSQYLR
ncbi:hypothetical protein MIV063R [Invertebrate iridescent virus 3]|uniref:Uncharacterized protein 063R n=1 Tax=Invertebrate iridescent virus 3 TaxID=345201 RepID=VF309_IIV3|nr:hypothetical protein MIV063R [Invertebrate iridescent virus 3]Q196Z7.1 RecName: Full=Uncharacterized protein 063R [Invertebrate iridescent virus 3]ABF82093.1 hypothetical protein MIV063R [Invertebrate iridescent virus 3]